MLVSSKYYLLCITESPPCGGACGGTAEGLCWVHCVLQVSNVAVGFSSLNSHKSFNVTNFLISIFCAQF